jgi:hypothetical protein
VGDPVGTREKSNAGVRLPPFAKKIIGQQPRIARNSYVFAGRGSVASGRLSLEDLIATHGCLLLPQICRVGRSQDVSSSVPPRTRYSSSMGKPVIQDPHSGQTSRVLIRPLSATRWSARGSMPESLNPPSGTTTPSEKALPVSR